MSTLNDDETPRITYAQNFEDVRLWKALADSEVRTYVDIGAADPTELSVTRLFYDRGWRGINLEPGPKFTALKRERPHDINLQVAVANENGTAEFHVASPYPDLSSLDPAALAADPDHVERTDVVEMQVRRLSTILAEHLSDRRIAFLKVDTEGLEFDVLLSNDWKRFRPFIVVVEAISPGTHTPSHDRWEPILLNADYEFALFDGINRFYVAAGRPDLIARLREPVSAVDFFVPSELAEARIQRSNDQAALTQYMTRIHQIDGELKIAKVELRATTEELQRVREALHEVEEGVRWRDVLIQELEKARAHFEGRVLEMQDALSWRIGRGIVEAASPVKLLLKPIKENAASRRGVQQREAEELSRVRRSESERVRAAYRVATAPGAPLETVLTMDPPEAYSPGAERFSVEPLDALWRDLAARRRDRPLLLVTDEFPLLERFVADENILSHGHTDVTDFADQILALHQKPDHLPISRAATTMVIDVRALQIPAWCGIKSHAANVLRSSLTHIGGRGRVLFLTTPQWPPLEPEFASLGDGEWNDGVGELETVGAFLQLAPFLMVAEKSSLGLLQAPWIKRACVWYDGIVGMYPHAYLRDAVGFLHYQLGLEQLSCHDRILADSQSSASEAANLLGDHVQISVTGSLTSLGVGRSSTRPDGLPFQRYVLGLGNGGPHKNLAATVAGFVPIAVRGPEELGLVIVTHLMSDDQLDALKELARGLGLEPHRLLILTQIPADQLLQLYEWAEATIIPSFHEGFSLPVIESIGAGTPVVVSEIPAHRELLNEDTWFFPAEDPVALSLALKRVLANPDACLTEQQSQIGRRFDGQAFDEAVAAAVEYLVEDIVSPSDEMALAAISTPAYATESSTPKPLSLSKICELEDFSHPRLEPIIREVFAHELVRFGADFPCGHEWRKYWEVAMTILTFKECGLLSGTREFLGIGAGNEPTIFYLTRFARRVLATDLYLSEGWDEGANSSMLTNPEFHWPFTMNPNRLAVEHMDALGLRLEDESVDAIFSSSSIEHFGQRGDVARAVDEAFRVLRPGGVFSVSSEFRLRGERPGIPGVLMFDEDDIDRVFLGKRDWNLIERFDPKISAETMATDSDFESVANEVFGQVSRYGGLWTHHIRFARYPHIVSSCPDHTWTSFHLALRKDGDLPR